jgi:PleD family two-component response regulator
MGFPVYAAASSHQIVTVSAGVAMVVARSGTKAAVLVRDADAALYCAKAQGRNAISSSDDRLLELGPLLSRAS